MISLLGINHSADIVGTAEIAQKHILCLWEVIQYDLIYSSLRYNRRGLFFFCFGKFSREQLP
jgi:hypothetical protein